MINSDAGLDKHFLNSLRILVGTVLIPAVLYVFSIFRTSSTPSFVVGDKKKEFLFEFFNCELKDFGSFGIFFNKIFFDLCEEVTEMA